MTTFEMSDHDSATLRRFASKLRSDPAFVAYSLHMFQQIEKLDESQLLEFLKLEQSALDRLSLCKRPDASQPEYSNKLRLISAYVGCDVGELATIFRRVDSILKLKDMPNVLASPHASSRSKTSIGGVMAAARDHNDANSEDSLEGEANGNDQD